MNKESNDKKQGDKKTCPSCGVEFLCTHDKDCWCMNYSLSSETLAFLRKNYSDCLCPPCLSRHGLPQNDIMKSYSRN